MKLKLKCKTIKKIPLVASLAFLVGCTTTPEPKPFNSEADKYAYVKEYMRCYIKEQMDDNDIVGMSVALVDDQKIVWQEGFGYEDKAKGIKATPQTRYRAGSITKLFNAMAVMKLSEEGKINIDKPLKTYLPEFKIKSRFGSTDNITPRNIMTHHSGLPGDWLDRMFATNPLSYTDYVKVIQNEYVAYRPNTIMSYSNLAITLLGHSVEKVSGMQYEDYIDKVLFSPMEMKNSDLHMALATNHASKSYKEGEEIVEYPIGTVPAGALNTSVSELAHLAIMINAKGMYKNHRVLNASTLNTMFKAQNKHVVLDLGEEIGLGYFINNTILNEKNTVYHHGGDTIGQHAYFAVAPRTKLGIVVMTNSVEANAPEIAKKLMQKAWEAKTGEQVIEAKISVNQTSDFEGVYSSMIGKVEITKSGKDAYVVETDSGIFTLNKAEGNLYKLKYKLLGLLPISNDDLDKVSLYTDDIEGKHVIVVSMNGGKMIGGVKIEKPTSIPEKWKSYIGHYKVLNNYEPKDWKIIDVEFVIEEGYPLIKTTHKSGQVGTVIVKPINDVEATIEGVGRRMKETIYYKDGIFHAQGLRFKKIEGKK